MKLQKKLVMLGVALATTGMLAVSNMSSVSAKEEIFDAVTIYNAVGKSDRSLLLMEYAFLYKNQTNPDALVIFNNRTLTVAERLKEAPFSKFEKALGLNKEQLEKARNSAIQKLDKLTQPKGIWKQTEEGWFYVIWYGHAGVAAEGWIQDGGNWYYLGTKGVMVTGWVKVDGNWYYLDESGAMKTGWFEVGGKWYYSYASGVLAVSTTIDGYTVNANGEWI